MFENPQKADQDPNRRMRPRAGPSPGVGEGGRSGRWSSS